MTAHVVQLHDSDADRRAAEHHRLVHAVACSCADLTRPVLREPISSSWDPYDAVADIAGPPWPWLTGGPRGGGRRE